MLEDAGAQSIAGWATAISPGPMHELTQSVSFTAGADNPALFTVQPAVAPDGTLSYTPAPDANGVATVTVTARDDGGTANGGTDTSAPRTFTITLTPVNDEPDLTTPANKTKLEDAGAQSVGGWATAITAGPANESAQNVTFTATADNPALFSVQPAIASDGTLSFTSAPDANGVATITVLAVDDGGTTNGGTDTSTPHTFTITLTPVNDAPSLTAGANKTALEDALPQSSGGWATAITPGPANESTQTVSFTASADDPALFSSSRPSLPTERSPTPRPPTPTASPPSPSPPSTTAAPPTAAPIRVPPAPSPSPSRPSTTLRASTLGRTRRPSRSSGFRPSQAGRRESRPGRRTKPPRASPSPSPTTTQGSSPSNPR